MNSGVSETLHDSQGKQSPGFKIAWQSALVLSFLTLFWVLASLSPWTDKSHPLALAGGAVILVLLWVPAIAMTIKWRERHPVSPRRLIRDNPQLWIVALYLILAVRDLNVLPTCDNGAYFKMVLEAVRHFNFVLGDSLTAMKLAGHPAQAYAAYMMLGQFLGFTHFQIANLQTYILHVIGILAFSGIVGYLFPGRDRMWERLLATALFAFTPLAYGLSLTMSPDFAVLAFLCLVIWSVLRNYPMLVVASAVMLCFTKEAGALLYAGLVLGIFGLRVPCQAWQSPTARWRTLATGVWRNLYLLLPLALYAFYIAKDGQLWIFSSVQDLASSTRLFPLDPRNLWDKTIQMFLANFNWMVWGLIGVSIPIGFLRRRRGAPQPQDPSRPGVWFVVLGVAMIPFILVNYIFLTWNNARYILPVCLFAAMFLPKALERLWRRRGLRIEMMAICLVLFGASSLRTVDPLLMRLFATFRFGEHRMSFYNSVATVCDLTFYNHEYVYYNRLFDRFLAEAGFDPAADELVFFTGNVWASFVNHNIEYLWTGGRLLGPLYIDPVSMTRTYDAAGNPVLRSTIFVRGESDLSILPSHAYSVELFWIRELRDLSISEMNDYYRVVREIRVEEDGYALVGYELVRRE
jgi:hypothetical protein